MLHIDGRGCPGRRAGKLWKFHLVIAAVKVSETFISTLACEYYSISNLCQKEKMCFYVYMTSSVLLY